MACVTITIYHSGSGENAIIGYTSSSVDGSFAEGNQAFGWGGKGTPTDQEYLQSVAIPQTVQFLNAKWVLLYGVPMTSNDICGQTLPIGTDNKNIILLIVVIIIGVYFLGGK